jgi:phosphatidylinositol glycan class M
MVATISTRGSSEGLLGVLTMGLLWAAEKRRFGLAAVVLGLGVHFKIYPFIYALAIVWWMDDERLGVRRISKSTSSPLSAVIRFFSRERVILAVQSLATFMSLNVLMYIM